MRRVGFDFLPDKKIVNEPAFCQVAYSPDGKWLATNSTRVRIWNAETWELLVELPVDGTSISGVDVAFSPDGTTD